jgi:resuscitation-promoting factor RpfB
VLDSGNTTPLAWRPVLALVPSVHRGDRRRGAVAAALLAAPLAVAGSALPAAWGFGAPVASADQISATRTQIASLEATVVAGAQRIHQLTVAYNQAAFEAGALAHEVGSARADVESLETQTLSISSQLRQQAISSYTGAYTGVPSVLPSGRGPDIAVRAEYVSVASGDLKDSVDRYRTSRRELSAAQAQLAAEQSAASAAVAEVGQARQAALAEASTDQARLDVLQAQLTSLVAAQAQQAQPKAAAVAAQARPPVQGLPINGGLVAVVQATVSSPPVPAAPPAKVPPSTTLPVVTAAPAPAPAAQSADGGAGGVWLQLRECESSDNYQANTGNGYFGAYQFSQQTWTDLGFPGRPDQAPPAMQDAAAQQLQAESGWGQWPACSAALGLS